MLHLLYFNPNLLQHRFQSNVKSLISSSHKRCTYYRILPEEGLIIQVEACRIIDQQINNTVQQFGIHSLSH